MHYQNAVMSTIDVVLGWDLPDAAIANAVKAKVGEMVDRGGD